MNAINEFDYSKEIQSSSDYIMSEVASEGGSFEDCQERVHEYVDGHKWIIYNYYHLQILANSENEDYGMDNGLVEGITNWSGMKQAMAFWAFYADIMEHIDEDEFSEYVKKESKYQYFGNYYQNMPELTWEQVESCSGSGSQDANVEALLSEINGEEFDLYAEEIAKELKEYGTWDDEELADIEQNKRRILWIACCNIDEDWETYKV